MATVDALYGMGRNGSSLQLIQAGRYTSGALAEMS